MKKSGQGLNKFLFLDIDGVLNYDSYMIQHIDLPYPLCDYDPEKVKLLNTVFHNVKDCKLVVCSGRRFDEGLGNEFKEVGIECEIYDITPSLSSANRGDEIFAYLDMQTEPYTYCIVDDCNDYWYHQQRHLIKTSSSVGLTKTDVIKIIKTLNRLDGEK